MYNHYIPDGAERVPVDHHAPSGHAGPSHASHQPRPDRSGKLGGLLSGLLGQGGGEANKVSQSLDRLLKGLHLEHLDTGDILLGLIVLFLVLEDGDDLDLIITLGLTILLNLGDP